MADISKIKTLDGTEYNIKDSTARSSIPAAATAAPLMDGTAAVGTATKYAREDHVHPAQTTVNGHTINSDVPANAVFTDTTYESKAAASGGTAVSLVTTGEKYTWNNKSNLALGTTSSTAYRGDYGNAAYAHGVTNKGSAFASGLYKITTNSEGHVTAATAVAKSDITALGIPAQDTTYESKTAVNGGTALSLVTTGEKYTWNSKGTYSKPSGGIPASDLASNVVSRIFPAGGSSGQFLAKNSVTDYDLGWADQTTYVTVSVTGALHTIDKTYDELRTLINNGNHVILTYYGDPYQLDSIKTSGTIKFVRYSINEADNVVAKVTFEITKSGTNTNVSRVVDTIYVPRVFVGATVFDMYNDGEGGYTVSCTGAEDMGDIFLANTTHSLSLTYHKVEMGEPGVDGVLEQYELVSSYTTNEYSSEIGDYMYTGHLVFNSVDTTSSKIKTFVISDVLYMDPYFENATITYNESPLGGGIVSQNVQVAANAWAQDATYTGFPYRAAIPLAGVTSSMIPEVIFSPNDAISGNYAPVADTATNTVYIYAKSEGAVSITIPTVSAR